MFIPEWRDVWICLLERTEGQIRESGPGMDHIAFSISENDFFQAVSRLQLHHADLVREPAFRGGGWSIQFRNPDGIILELFTGNLEKRMMDWTSS